MQLVEVSVTGVRSAVITLEAAGTPLRIVLFPMVHVGHPPDDWPLPQPG